MIYLIKHLEIQLGNTNCKRHSRRAMESKLSIKHKDCVKYNPNGLSYMFILKHEEIIP